MDRQRVDCLSRCATARRSFSPKRQVPDHIIETTEVAALPNQINDLTVTVIAGIEALQASADCSRGRRPAPAARWHARRAESAAGPPGWLRLGHQQSQMTADAWGPVVDFGPKSTATLVSRWRHEPQRRSRGTALTSVAVDFSLISTSAAYSI
ncbi:hypothetical protein [Micromonospora sp. NPDC002717]|uniref:hypothetical protein n=1 Tax=Micromonospora sp. NPDC002717 TaxID=3154424 RepID=UPI00331EDE7D